MAAERLTTCLNLRRSIKGQLTRLFNFVVEINTKEPEQLSRMDMLNLESRAQAARSLQNKYSDIQDEIESLVSSEDLDAQDEEREKFNSNIFKFLAEVNFLIENYNVHSISLVNEASASSSTRSAAPERQRISEIKLPTINIPEFDGSYDKWVEFNDIFKAVIHNNQNLPDVQKFCYLKSALSGYAGSVIHSIEVSAANYSVAWQLLCDRFENTTLIINHYVRSLFELAPINRESAVTLRQLLDSVNKNIRCLTALKQPTEQWDTLVNYLVISKFDNITRREWEQERSGKPNLPKFEEVQGFLEKKCVALENLQATKSDSQPNTFKKQSNQNSRYNNTHTNNKQQSMTLLSVNTCMICKQGNHPLYYCNTFKSLPISQRINEVRKARLCLNCFKGNHATTNCQSSRCRMCNGMHNTLLHLQSRNQNQHINTNQTQNQPNYSESSDPNDTFSSNYNQNQHYTNNQNQTYTQNPNQTYTQNSNQSYTQNQNPKQNRSRNQNQNVTQTRDYNQKQNYSTNRNQNNTQFDSNDSNQIGMPNQEQLFSHHSTQSNEQNPSCSQNCNQMSLTNHSSNTNHIQNEHNLGVKEVLLSTALVDVKTESGSLQSCRVLLDPGSQSNFILLSTCKKLGIAVKRNKTNLSGINEASSRSNYITEITFKSQLNNFETKIKCLAVPKITADLPVRSFNKSIINIPNNIQMADPLFNQSSQIDILLGAGVFWHLLTIGQIKLGTNLPILQKTQLGWILGGDLFTNETFEQQSISCVNTLESMVTSFWNMENIRTDRMLTPEESACENHFIKNTSRNSEGRFVVKVPLKSNHEPLGNSLSQARKRFFALERKFRILPNLKQSYVQFMKEYQTLGHMSKITLDNGSFNSREFYLPHHPVIREESLTTKIRVVFDGSCTTDNNNSLNSIQMTGPVVQNDLFSILLRFRQHQFVITGDVEKMYRQILIHKDDRPLQRILWRENENDSLSVFELNTVTYGTTSAPFLATRCLNELSNIYANEYPIESSIIKNDFYVDDVLTGANSVQKLQIIKENLTHILKTAKLDLRKWLSNSTEVINQDGGCEDNQFLNLSEHTEAKTLGLIWNAKLDTLQCCVGDSANQNSGKVTKRLILSLTSQIFDPLGLFAPTVILAKIILQQLWQLHLSWDESVPAHIHTQWIILQKQFHLLALIKIPRYAFDQNSNDTEIHGFCDASEKAYGACIYVRSINKDNKFVVRLLTAKSRVAPIKPITLPRLELCAAVLLANLMHTTLKAIPLHSQNIFYWSDSTIALAWIKSNPTRWKTFVANRVTEIQNKSSIELWNHVQTEFNPADIISRGAMPNNMQSLQLWWHGPAWLQHESVHWPSSNKVQIEDAPESKITSSIHCSVSVNLDLFSKFSSFTKLKRVVAYCMRFIRNCKLSKADRLHDSLSCAELEWSTQILVRISQHECFLVELNILKKGDQLKPKSVLANLNIFIDKTGILRVGGRLRQSSMPYQKKHPMLLSSKHKLTKMIATSEHVRMLHCGQQELLYSLRERYWPTSGRNLTRQVIRNCVKCFRTNPLSGSQQMGDLPPFRITPANPFTICSTDYAGPLNIRDRKGRGYKIHKTYICLFVCCSTKAIHLELVTDLTSDCFIAAFRRFVSRRGRPSDIYSDNATNYTGADSKLNEFLKFIREIKHDIAEATAEVGVNWHFIPARTPHFGGLWEAAVKSVKHHLRRVVGESLLTYEELSTVLMQIEAVLNSRPLSTLNSDPNDPYPLTPAHFLIGRTFTNLPDCDLSHVPENRMDTYQRIQHMVQCFWKRWQKEYLNELQARTKWKGQTAHTPEVGDVVVLKEENLPPLKWPIGRIVELHPGADKIVRVVTVRLRNGHLVKRGIVKICIFPKTQS